MFITDRKELEKYYTSTRNWQGIPSIAVTKKGRLFASWFSGKQTEELGNYALWVKSDDFGNTFSEPIAVAYVGEEKRAYDPNVFCDPLGRVWFIWSVMPQNHLEYVICEDPDADVLEFSEIKTIPDADVMLNKPIFTKNGDWLFPMCVWDYKLVVNCGLGADGNPTGAHVYRSTDCGKTLEKISTVIAKDRFYDEHRLLERDNGDIEMYIRTSYGIAKAVSKDGGKTFEEDQKAFDGPNARFAIHRLSSGNILFVNYNSDKRENLTAYLYDKDFNLLGQKLLDGREWVAYPDIQEYDGYIYIIYDRERGAIYNRDVDYSDSAREILLAKLTERDIIDGTLKNSMLQHIVSKIYKK